MRRLIAAVLILGITSPAFADVRGSVTREAALAARASAQARPNAPSNEDNPYFVPSVVLMAVGASVALYGMTHDTGVACSGIGTVGLSCGLTKSKATIFTGVGIAGVGAYLFYKGRAKSSPEIIAGPNVLGVRQRLAW